MNLYSIPPLFCSILAIFLGLFVYSRNKKSQINISFALLCLSTFWWQFSWFILFNIHNNNSLALYLIKIGYIGIVFIPFTFYHFVISFLRLKQERRNVVLFYVLGSVFIIALWTTNYFISGYYNYFWGYYPKANFLHVAYLFFLFFSATRGLVFLLRSIIKERTSPNLYNQLKYSFTGFIIYAISSTDFLVNYGVEFYPLGFIPVCLSLAIFTYTIVRYQFLDINTALTRAGIFVLVYLFVLGIPFVLGYKYGQWQLATWITVFLATSGPFIYTYLRRQAEERILHEEHHAHQLLMQGSSGMTQIRDLRKLLNLIVHFVPKIMKVRNASIFLLNNELTQYIQVAVRFKNNSRTVTAIDVNDPLILYLKEKRAPLVYEEIKSRPDDKQFPKSEILSQMKALSAAVILPCFIEDALLGFLILDEKRSGRMYTPEDLNVLTTLTNQAALAFENAQFYARDRENQALLYQSATLADMGVMADSMGHQIKNHIQKMMAEAGGNAGILEEILKQGIDNEKALQLLKRQIDILYSIEKQGEAGGRLIESISKFSRLPKAAFREITLKEILDTANDILRFKVKFDEIDYNIRIPDNLPIFYAHPILSEAFVNLIDNAYDAIREKEQEIELESKKTGQSASYRGSISFTATQQNNSVEIQVKDNGIGIKKENIPNLFLPFYTTKATSAKGTGLGLFVIKKIVSNHKGAIKIDSEYMQGTTFTITIPIRQER